MVAWSVELFKFGLKFKAHGPIKAQCLADFIVELSPSTDPNSIDGGDWWMFYIDKACNTKGSGAGITLEGPGDISLEQSLRFDFKISNNQVEYEALIACLKLENEVRVKKIRCRSDSELVTSR